jgi:arylformamidase
MIYDVTLTISNELPIWPGDPAVKLYRVLDMARGDSYTVSRLECGVHTGTHIDAPAHFIAGGAGAHAIDLDVLVGPCQVVQVRGVDVITAETLDSLAIPAGTTRLLFKTRNSEFWARGEKTFQTDFVAIDQSGAAWIVAHGIQLVGIDYLSIAPFEASSPTHNILLQAGVVAIEGLNLSGIELGRYQLICLPIKLQDSDGAPARAILIK